MFLGVNEGTVPASMHVTSFRPKETTSPFTGMPVTYHDAPVSGVSPFRQAKLEKDAKKNWDLFYKRNGDRFYKDRHWTVREFAELLQPGEDGSDRILLEVGCGVGNFIFPLLQDQVPLYFYGCDFSDVAISICNSNPAADASKCSFFVSDLTSTLR